MGSVLICGGFGLAFAAVLGGVLGAAGAAAAEDAVVPGPVDVVVTARLRPETAQSVPVAITAIDRTTLQETRTDNVSLLTQLAPSVNYSSPNPRNTALTIRGMGSSVLAIAQANDGLEPGVGVYVDQVYHARPATAAFDFSDVESVEVLRGPQGTVFGKNTTAGAVTITTRAPVFHPEAEAEVSGGDYGFAQTKATVSGPLLGDLVAGRLSVVGSVRDGLLRNVTTGGRDNTLGTFDIHGQLLIRPTSALSIRLSADNERIDETCCTQVYVTVGSSLKPAARQYPALAAGLGYAPPSLNPYARLTDIDAPLKVKTDEGGLSSVVEWSLPKLLFTSVTAWRWWNWDAANDRDYTGLSIQTLQHIPSRQDQYSQELRVASRAASNLDYVGGLYFFNQGITGEPITQYGPLATYWLLGPASTYPGALLNGYGTDGRTRFHATSVAAFGEATWRPIARLALTGGLRYTRETKNGAYESTVYGGLAPTTTAQANALLSILRPQAYQASNADDSLSGRAAASFEVTKTLTAYASFARVSKSGGLNMSGLPLNAANQPALATAVIKPEQNATWEIGVKGRALGGRLQMAADLFETVVHDFQTNVVDTGPGALRGYLANIDKVRVKGAEADARFIANAYLTARASVSLTDGRYVGYKNGPCPLELIASTTTVCDLSGRPLSGLPSSIWSLGAEAHQPAQAFSVAGEVFARADAVLKTHQYGDPSDSRYALLPGYGLLNASVGFRAAGGWEAAFWVRNLSDAHYLQNVTVQSGNSGLVVGTPGDPRTMGVLIRARF